jgi:murein DD-endopeptidase MepM/ murein hydrolase activator NlpD
MSNYKQTSPAKASTPLWSRGFSRKNIGFSRMFFGFSQCTLALFILFLTACDALPATLPIFPTPSAQPSPSAALLPNETRIVETAIAPAPVSPSDNPLATAILSLDSSATQQPNLPTATALPDPLKLVYPTAAAAVVSAWRPPLYPVPWAPTPYDHFYFVRPIAADKRNWPTADYRYGGVFFEDVVHTGVDIPAPEGTPILAAGPGKIVWAGYGIYRGINDPTDPYGLAVVIRHDFGYGGENLYTIYGHLSEIDVLEGQHVESSELIGLAGQTGQVTGPHLHFEVRIGDNTYFTTRNPELWIAPPQGWGVLAGRVMDSGKQLLYGQLFELANQNQEVWTARSYGKEAANSDPYYRENLVIGDLPAGVYDLYTSYSGVFYITTVQIYPGMVTYFTFTGHYDFDLVLPALPGARFTPEPLP